VPGAGWLDDLGERPGEPATGDGLGVAVT